jgi:integrase
MFEYAIKMNWLAVNVVLRTRRPTYEPRQRYLKEDEVKAFFAAVESIKSEKAWDFILMCLWTGARRDNVASMEWAEITKDVWVIPTSKYKGKRPQLIPLSSPAVETLERRKANRKEVARYVFPGRGQKGYYADPKSAWQMILVLHTVV